MLLTFENFSFFLQDFDRKLYELEIEFRSKFTSLVFC